MIKIICMGKIKEKYLEDLINDYKKRLTKYTKVEIIELKEEKTIDEEAKKIEKYITNHDYVISCAIEGKKFNSVDFANYIDKTLINYSNIDFIIGSSEGLSKEIKDKSNLLLSFSDFTMPHGLFRGVLLEQIYRAYKINNNETYHK